MIRLHVTGPLAEGQSVPLTREQAHYLGNVMRLGPGAAVEAFDGASGGWRATVADLSKRGGTLACVERVRPQRHPPDVWLLFAPIKKARTDFIVEKGVELGAARLVPVLTRHTNSERVRVDRLQAHAVEAAEQCGGTHVPEVAEPVRLDRLLDGWAGRALVFADETLSRDPDWAGPDGAGAAALPPPPAAILVGPEGGFAPEERDRIRALPEAHPVALGPRILRADTAAVAALTLWQAARGDWS